VPGHPPVIYHQPSYHGYHHRYHPQGGFHYYGRGFGFSIGF
jgi:hypothetical protein